MRPGGGVSGAAGGGYPRRRRTEPLLFLALGVAAAALLFYSQGQVADGHSNEFAPAWMSRVVAAAGGRGAAAASGRAAESAFGERFLGAAPRTRGRVIVQPGGASSAEAAAAAVAAASESSAPTPSRMPAAAAPSSPAATPSAEALPPSPSASESPAAEEKSPTPSPSSAPYSPAPDVKKGKPFTAAELAEYAPASSLVTSPSAEAMASARRVLALSASLPGAGDGALWSTQREASVDAQRVMVAALATETQYHVSRLAVSSASAMRPCKRLVVSVATIPSRIDRLYNLISTLRRQNLPPDQVLVAVPAFATRLKQAYVVPDYLKNDTFVKLVPLPADYGPLSKLAAALSAEKDPDTCIVTIDDDSEAREFLLQIMATWGAIFPDSVVSAQGWNVTCIVGRLPYVCPGHHGEPYLFVRQSYDHMCLPESLVLYNFHHCLSPVNKTSPRSADVVMGAASPLYRRGMFGADFLDLAKVTALDKIARMLQAHYVAVGAPRTLAQLREPAVPPSLGAPAPGGDVLAQPLVELAHGALAHPELAETPGMATWRAAQPPPPEALFLVDDIYISAYLNRAGISRIVVPWGDENQCRTPVPMLEPAAAKPLPSQPPRPGNEEALLKVERNVGAIDALHGVAGFDAGNVAAVRFFAAHKYWDEPRWPRP